MVSLNSAQLKNAEFIRSQYSITYRDLAKLITPDFVGVGILALH
jgi:hypothetical protein